MKKIFLLVFMISLLLCAGSLADETPFDLNVQLQEGIKAESSGDQEFAIESFRKVLFIDGTNARAQYGLARALDKSDKKKKALREYRLFVRIAQGDTALPQSEKEQYVAEAKKAIETLCEGKQGLGCLTFVEINIIIVTIILTITFLIKLLRLIFRIFPEISSEDKKLVAMLRDKKSAKNDERDFRIFPFDILSVAMFVLLIFFYWLVYSMIICK